jgi:hypothetical protein
MQGYGVVDGQLVDNHEKTAKYLFSFSPEL